MRAMPWLLLALLLAAPPAEDPLEQLNAALEQEDFQTAAPLLESLLEEHPEEANLQFQLAFAYTRLGRSVEAVERYRKALELDATMAPARLNLALLLLDTDQPESAIAELEALLALRPDDPQAVRMLGHAYLRAQQPAKAVPYLDKAVAQDPQPQSRIELARALMDLKRWDAAAEQIAVLAEADPALAAMRIELAERVELAGDVEKALGLYQAHAAEQADPDAALLERIGFLLLNLERGEEAIGPLERAVSKSATPANRAALAQAYSIAKKTEEALDQLYSANVAAPDDPQLALRYANALLAQQQYEKAGPQYLRVTKLDPDLPEGWNGLAFCFYQSENYPATLQALAESAKRAPETAASIFLRALAEDKLKLYEQAQLSYRAFLEANPTSEDNIWQAQQRLSLIDRVLEKR